MTVAFSPEQKPDKAGAARKKAKRKGSMADSLAVLRSSPKILNLALLVMSYGVSHRLFEFAWKGQLGVLYPSAQQYQVCSRLPPHAALWWLGEQDPWAGASRDLGRRNASLARGY